MFKNKREDEAQTLLDNAFNDFVEQMKNFVLNLENKNDRQNISSWIKKLSSSSIESVTERKNRNLYAQILLNMLKIGSLKEPFLLKPPSGKLATIPAYMSSYLDDTQPIQAKKPFNGPEWLQGEEFEDSILYQTINHESYHKYKEILTPRKHERFMLANSLLESTSSPKVISDSLINKDDNDDEGNLENSELHDLEMYLNETKRTNMNSTEIQSKHQHRNFNTAKKRNLFNAKTKKNTNEKEVSHGDGNGSKEVLSREKELELKLRMVEGNLQEETLKIQQQHDQIVKKILDRKNHEQNDMKTYYQSKLKELEDALKDYENKVKNIKDEMNVVRHKHANEVNTLKEAIHRKAASTASEYEKMMYDKLSDFETEIFNIQKTHRLNISELIAEADEKMTSLKEDFTVQNDELKMQILGLKKKLEDAETSNNIIVDERKSLNAQKERLDGELRSTIESRDEAWKKIALLEKENSILKKESDDVVTNLRKKSDQAFEEMKKERTTTAKKTAETISELEGKINQYRQTVHDVELKRQRELREQEAIHKQASIQMETEQEQKIRSIQSDFEKKKLDYHSRIGQYELTIKEKEVETRKLEMKLNEHTKDTEILIENFKEQAEDNGNKMYEEFQSQLKNLSGSLNYAREKIDRQKSESLEKFDAQKQLYETEISKMKESYANESNELKKQFKQEYAKMEEAHHKEKEEHSLKHQNTMKEIEKKYKLHLLELGQTNTELEVQVRNLREEVIQANSLRQQQMQEIGTLREEEKQAAKRNQEVQLSKYKSQLEQVKLQNQKEYSTQITEYTEKMEARLNDIEKEYSKKTVQDKEMILSLQSQVADMKVEHFSKVDVLESQLKDMNTKHKQDKNKEKDQFMETKQKLVEEMETQTIKYKQLEKKYRNLEIQSQSRISRCRMEYEEKLKGMLPIDMKKELEDTIDSLKQQIHMLQSRADVLQEELELSTRFIQSKTSIIEGENYPT